ncbi:MAG: hypothetical protein ACI8TE_001537 [Francisella sp.]|jgi:hypothetical protein
MSDGLDYVIAGSCNTSSSISIDQNSTTNGGCAEIAKLNDISKILGMVYTRYRLLLDRLAQKAQPLQ